MSKVIVLDPGHGGYDPGAVGPTGIKEKDVTLTVASKLAEKLRQSGFEVHLTRNSDQTLWDNDNDLQMRCDIANRRRATLFISIHCNSADNHAACGFEVYTTPGQGASDPLAEAIVQAWAKAFPQMVIRKDLADGDSDKEANFYVLRKTDMPAILIELAFISNPDEEKLLADPGFQDRCAQAIVAGVKKYLGIEEDRSMAEKWKEDIMAWGRQNLNISPEHQAEEAAPKWFVLAVAQRSIEVATKKVMEAIKNGR